MRSRVFDWLIDAYRAFISPVLHALAGPGSGCRFEPTCSEYARACFHQHGLFRGACLASWRLLRCHPFSKTSHVDPVPEHFPVIRGKGFTHRI